MKDAPYARYITAMHNAADALEEAAGVLEGIAAAHTKGPLWVVNYEREMARQHRAQAGSLRREVHPA